MEQRFEGSPRAEIRLEGKRVTRSEVTHDWGLLLQWQIQRDGRVVATKPARAELTYEHADDSPGEYEIVLQMWRYVNYAKDAQGEFTQSRFVDISNKVGYSISW